MWFEQIIRTETGCASYMIGADVTKECVVFDPLWDIIPYLETARQKGAVIRFVIDSHSHADHVSGARRLVEATSATLVLPALADVSYAARRVTDGESIHMGEVALQFMHTPGHRPEQMCLLVTDRSKREQPEAILTADCLFVGDLGRPDLAQAGEAGAAVLFDKTVPRLLALPDAISVYPGHVAGST